MKYIIPILLLVQFSACAGVKNATRDNVPLTMADEQKLQHAIGLYDQGDYDGALEIFIPLTESAPDNAEVFYETAITLNRMGQFAESQRYALRGLEISSPTQPRLHHVVGINYDMLGEQDKAAKALKRGIKEDGTYYSLHYSLAIVEMNRGNFEAAVESFENTIALVPTHANSHLGIANARRAQGKQLEPLLAATFYLVAATDSDQAPAVREMVWEILTGAVEKTGENEFTLSVVLGEDDDDPISAIEMMMPLMAASMVLPEKAEMQRIEHLAEQYDFVLGMLSEKSRKQSDRVLWKMYVPFFSSVHEDGFTETLVYRLFNTEAFGDAEEWIENNRDKLDALDKWLGSMDTDGR